MSQKIALAMLIAAALSWSGCGKRVPYGSPDGSGSEVVSGSFIVPARAFTPFKVVVPEGVGNPRLAGTFTTSGGSGNDIEVVLLDDVQFLNWQNRHEYASSYESGRITADRVDVPLPSTPATYFMVFSNRFSLLSSKSVEANLWLRYDD